MKAAMRRVMTDLKNISRGASAPGISAWPQSEQSYEVIDAEICGAPDTPYEKGVFRLEINIPAEYPLKPPRVRFITKIYHPNIDSEGRICLDLLNMPPKGAWKPSHTISSILITIQALMSDPNGDDGLMVDITDEFRRNPGLFRKNAKAWTMQFARGENLDGVPCVEVHKQSENIKKTDEKNAAKSSVDEDENEIQPASPTRSVDERPERDSRLKKRVRRKY